MKNSMILTIVGLLLLPVTMFIGYLYMQSLNDHGNLLFLGLTIILGGTGVYCLIRGTNPKEKSAVATADAPTVDAALEGALKRNNKIEAEYSEANAKKEKLEMMGITGATSEPQK